MNDKLYSPKGSTDTGYRIEEGIDGFRWVWVEAHEEDDAGPWEDRKSDVLNQAADDWATNGSAGLTGKDQLTATLRALATKARKEEEK